jgi:hypothetical protein
MKKRIDNFILEGCPLTPVEQALMDGTFEQLLSESLDDSFEDIPSDFLELQDFDDAMEEIKAEIEKWM